MLALCVHANLASATICRAAAFDGFAQALATTFAIATLGVVFTGSDAGAVDALAVVALFVKDTGVVLCLTLTINAQLVVLAIVAVKALRLLLIDALEVTTHLAICAWVARIALGC